MFNPPKGFEPFPHEYIQESIHQTSKTEHTAHILRMWHIYTISGSFFPVNVNTYSKHDHRGYENWDMNL